MFKDDLESEISRFQEEKAVENTDAPLDQASWWQRGVTPRQLPKYQRRRNLPRAHCLFWTSLFKGSSGEVGQKLDICKSKGKNLSDGDC